MNSTIWRNCTFTCPWSTRVSRYTFNSEFLQEFFNWDKFLLTFSHTAVNIAPRLWQQRKVCVSIYNCIILVVMRSTFACNAINIFTKPMTWSIIMQQSIRKYIPAGHAANVLHKWVNWRHTNDCIHSTNRFHASNVMKPLCHNPAYPYM